MEPSGKREPGVPFAIRAAPAALATLMGVVVLVLQTTPVRPYADGSWAGGDLLALFVVGLVVGVLNRSVSGLVGTIAGATAAIAIQLYVLSESASYTTNVVATLGEPAWTRQVLGALAIGLTSLVGGYIVGALAGLLSTSLRSHGSPTRPAAASFIGRGLIAGLSLAVAAGLALALVRATATSAYVPSESQPVLRVSVQGDRIVAVAPETISGGRVVIDVARSGGTQPRWISIEGPLTPDVEAVLAAGNDPLVGGLSRQWPASNEVVHQGGQADLWPGRYAIVVSAGYPEASPGDNGFPAATPWDTGPPVVPALDIRRIVVSGPEPTDYRSATGGPVAILGFVFGLSVAGWGTGGSLVVARRGRNRAAAAIVGVVAAGALWLLTTLAIGQSHSPF
jgi:hypothetical protein